MHLTRRMVQRGMYRRAASEPRGSSRLSCRRTGHNVQNCTSSLSAFSFLAKCWPHVRNGPVHCASSGFGNPDIRDAAKRLSNIFYKDAAEPTSQQSVIHTGSACSSPSPPSICSPAPAHMALYNNNPSRQPHEKYDFVTCSPSLMLPLLQNLPLWRADAAAVVGQQLLLHVHTPHYVHMFDRLFAACPNGPWVFGHVHLPAGSRNLGASEWALCVPGSRAPKIGVLMEINRAVRLEDGKLMILATALYRIQVRQCRSETPYSSAVVEILHDEELLESYHTIGLEAGQWHADGERTAAAAVGALAEREMDASAGCAAAAASATAASSADSRGERQAQAPLPHAAPAKSELLAAAAPAQAAATASLWRWLDYEAFTARAAGWPESPMEGADPEDTRRLVSELIDHGVPSVVPFADGFVAGRWDLGALRALAAADAAAAARAATAEGAKASNASGPKPESTRCAAAQLSTRAASTQRRDEEASEGGDGAGGGVLYNLDWSGPDGLEPTQRAQGMGPVRHSGGSTPSDSVLARSVTCSTGGVEGFQDEEGEKGLTGHTTYDLLLLESRLWRELDVLAMLQARVHNQRLGLPLGLLQLRPSDELAATQVGASAPSSVVVDQQQRRSDADRGEAFAAGTSQDFRMEEGRFACSTTGGNGDSTARHAGATESRITPLSANGLRGLPSSGGGRNNSNADWFTDGMPQQALPHSSAQPQVHPASEGLDVYCHPDYPLERRVMRLSYAAAGIFIEAQDSVSRQQILEMPSVRIRLEAMLRRARMARNILAAMAAVKDLQSEQR